MHSIELMTDCPHDPLGPGTRIAQRWTIGDDFGRDDWWGAVQSFRREAERLLIARDVDTAWILWDTNEAYPICTLYRADVAAPREATPITQVWFSEGMPPRSPWSTDGDYDDDPTWRPGANF